MLSDNMLFFNLIIKKEKKWKSSTPYGEAVVEIEGYPFKVSPTSTIANIFIMDAINAKTCEILASHSFKPPVWISGNIPGGTESNQEAMDKYFGVLRHL